MFGTLRPRNLLLLSLLAGVLFAGGFAVGRFGSATPLGVANFQDFNQVRQLIDQKYPNKVDQQNLVIGATKGLVQGLDDPYSVYLTADEAKQLDQALAGTVEGIGVEIGEQNNQIIVIAPLPGSPAARAGITASEAIISVDDKPTAGKTLDDVAKEIRGPKGTPVTVEVKKGETPARKLTLTRETVKAPSVSVEYKDGIAVINLSRYGEDIKTELDKIVGDIQAKQPRGIVLDLRSNPGGFLDGAISVTGVFVDGDPVVVKEKFAGGREDEQRATPDGRLSKFPLVVLVNKGTASASEITAGALRDIRGIKLVGEKTFGKGSVQELEPLTGGAELKLTIAEYFTPKGTTVNKQGLSPDVESSSDNLEAQLQAALNLLK